MSTDHDDFATEPVPGLPARLPEGETLLWQGAPDWKLLAWRGFHLRYVAAYFGVLIGWTGFSTLWVGGGWPMALRSVVPVTVAGLVALALLALVAWLIGRSTVYSITSKRVVMRFGVALPMTFNLPFACIEAAAVRRAPDGSGDISLSMAEDGGLNALVLWPHARPWQWRKPQPSLRALRRLDEVAGLLAQALKAAHPEGAAHAVTPVSRPVAQPERELPEGQSLASATR